MTQLQLDVFKDRVFNSCPNANGDVDTGCGCNQWNCLIDYLFKLGVMCGIK